MIREYLSGKSWETGHFSPCPKAADRAVWAEIYRREQVLSECEKIREVLEREGIPQIPLKLWLDYCETGTRTRFEAVFFARRRDLAMLALGEATAHDGAYLEQIGSLVWAILEESAWNLPAHNSYLRNAASLPLPDRSRPIVELFAAETGALLAMVSHLLGDELEARFPGMLRQIRLALRDRIILPLLRFHFWWMGGDGEAVNNWTTWCFQNVLITASVLYEASAADETPVQEAIRAKTRPQGPGAGSYDGETLPDGRYVSEAQLRDLIEKCAVGLDNFLDDYGEDGCCSEGAQYYRHAGLTLYACLDILEHLTGGATAAVWKEPKIRNIAEYIAYVHVDGDYYLNFADCSPCAGYRTIREVLFGRAVGSAFLEKFAAESFLADPDPYRAQNPDAGEGINLFYDCRTALYGKELRDSGTGGRRGEDEDASDREAGSAGEGSGTERFKYYPRCGLWIRRRGRFFAGLKAGNNADSHNHNDVGSFTVYLDGKPLLIDVGVESYTSKTFSDRRYEIWTMQSSYHNLPAFDPDGRNIMQHDGEEYCATDVELSPDHNEIRMNLAGAYTAHGEVPEMKAYRRSFRVEEGAILVRDETDFPGKVRIYLMTAEPVRRESEQTWLIGERCRLVLPAAAHADTAPGALNAGEASLSCETERIHVEDPRLRLAWPETLYRTGITFEREIALRFEPVRETS